MSALRAEDYQRRTDAIKAVLLRNWPTMCDDGYDLGAVAHDLLLAATPLPAAPAHDAVGDAADRIAALRAQRAVVTRKYARDPSNENEAALYAICERVYAAERARDEKGGE